MKSPTRIRTFASVLAMVALVLLGSGEPSGAETWQTQFDWKDAGIGSPIPTGSHTWEDNTLTLTGGGAGLNRGQRHGLERTRAIRG